MVIVTVQKTVEDVNGVETTYTYTAQAPTVEEATQRACLYASMVEYGLIADAWQPSEMAFPREQLYQFIQPSQLEILEQMYPEAVPVAYQNALAYVQSYIGNMFNVDEMLQADDTTSMSLTLRLALAIQTAVFLLASSPQYAETTEMHKKDVHALLAGLKSGRRNFGKQGIEAEPNVRVAVVSLRKTGAKP